MRKLMAFIITVMLTSLHAAAQGEWVQENDFPGAERQSAVSFSLDGKGYVVSGSNSSGYLSDFWEFDGTGKQWIQRTDFNGAGRTLAVGAGVSGKVFVGTGSSSPGTAMSDWREYGVFTGDWTQKTSFAGPARNNAASFELGTKIYIGTGTDGIAYLNDFWEYDTETDTWTQKAQFPGRERVGAISFALGNRGYIGLGFSTVGDYRLDIFEYRPENNNWVRQIEEFPGLGREGAASFSSEELGKGYIVCGHRKLNTYMRDCWEFDQSTGIWTKIAGFPETVQGRNAPIGFAINGVAYVGCGIDSLGNHLKDFWSYELPTSARAIPAIEARMFPNPVNDHLVIELDVNGIFTLYDLKGCAMMEAPVTHGKNIVWFADIPDGSYLYRISSNGKLASGKILKSE